MAFSDKHTRAIYNAYNISIRMILEEIKNGIEKRASEFAALCYPNRNHICHDASKDAYIVGASDQYEADRKEMERLKELIESMYDGSTWTSFKQQNNI